jgi:cytochrome c peroxidase
VLIQRVLILLVMITCSRLAGAEAPAVVVPDNEPIRPIPLSVNVDPRKVALGEKLFNEPRLAKNNAMPCAFCHQLAQGGDDGLPRSITNTGEPDVINSPTVFNSVFNFRQTWRGAFRSLEAQAEGDLHNPRHGNTTWDELLPKLRNDTRYAGLFGDIYPDGITRDTVLDAIAAFERSLITPNAAFDRYLRGYRNAISPEQVRGYAMFKQYGCIACHQGVNVGGNLFQKLGIFGDYFAERGDITKADLGRFNVTGREEDRHVFRVPSLRNVAVTAPYFHDGSINSLHTAVTLMAKYQLGRPIPAQDVELIVLFLESLTGEYQGQSLAETGEPAP